MAGSLVLAVCGLIAAGCGDDDSTTGDSSSTTATTSSTASDTPAADSVDQAVEACTKTAQEMGDAAAAGLETACTTVGDNVKAALAQGGAQAEQALQQTADSCKQAVSGLPAGEAQDALTDLCAAIEAG
jgi:hypothetical protein